MRNLTSHMRAGAMALLILLLAMPAPAAAAMASSGAIATTLASETTMPTYNPVEHPRLSEEAAALDPTVLEAYADEAEALFGIAGTDFEGQNATDLTLAVVRQINLTVRLEQHGAGAIQTESKGDQSVTVMRYVKTGAPIQIDAIAQQIVSRVLASAAAETDGGELPLASSSAPIVFTW